MTNDLSNYFAYSQVMPIYNIAIINKEWLFIIEVKFKKLE